ncbi:hypothetical protein NDU88_001000 [Pleurodeles waltl]|uniref:CCHC-type domain-containing protein n=1 Tax=Pleurodeles waltl TaxID=8319 RepID=A0AAV7UTG8_PLEWA|nr:hypothetical protein NDU88_001000 [Pleurodeles waltl]
MSLYHKVIEHLKTKVASKNVDWQRIDRTAQEAKESIHAHYERLLKAFKNYSGTETIEAKDMLHFLFRFVEGLRPEVSQMIKMHLICWQSKSIDEVLNYAKYCSDEIETKQKRLKGKVMVMQLRAAQTGLQGLQGFQQQMPQQQQQGNAMFQPQMRGRGRGGFVNNGPDLNTVMIPNGIQAMKKVMPCHTCGIVGHWKRECPKMVQEGVGQQNNDFNAFQNMRGPKLRGPNPNFQNNVNQMQGLQPIQPQQVQMHLAQMAQLQPMQQQFPMVPNQQMQIPLAPMNQQQVMLPQQVTGQGMNQNDTVHKFPLHSENGINDAWESESSDEEGNCMLAASLEVDQKGPYVEGRVMGHRVSFLVDTGATRSTVRSVEVPNLPLSGRTVQVVGVANRYLTNPITDPVQVRIGNYEGSHKFVVCDSSPISLLGRDLLCKLGCSIMCSNDGIKIQTNSNGEEEDGVGGDEVETVDEEYPLISLYSMLIEADIPAELQETVAKPLLKLTQKDAQDEIELKGDEMDAFIELKECMCRAPALADVVRSFSHQVEANTLPPIQGPGHALKAGDWVVIKKHVRKLCLEPRWKGPFQVILTTTTAVKCAGVPNWIHASHTKRLTCPTEEEVEALKSPVSDKRVPGTETEQREPGGEQVEIEEGEIFSEEEATDPFEEDQGEASGSDEGPEGDKEPETGEGDKEPETSEGDKRPETAIVLGMHGKDEKETNDASTSKPITELTPLKKLEQDERHLHDKKELSSNVFYRLLSEYVETMDVKDC